MVALCLPKFNFDISFVFFFKNFNINVTHCLLNLKPKDFSGLYNIFVWFIFWLVTNLLDRDEGWMRDTVSAKTNCWLSGDLSSQTVSSCFRNLVSHYPPHTEPKSSKKHTQTVKPSHFSNHNSYKCLNQSEGRIGALHQLHFKLVKGRGQAVWRMSSLQPLQCCTGPIHYFFCDRCFWE